MNIVYKIIENIISTLKFISDRNNFYIHLEITNDDFNELYNVEFGK